MHYSSRWHHKLLAKPAPTRGRVSHYSSRLYCRLLAKPAPTKYYGFWGANLLKIFSNIQFMTVINDIETLDSLFWDAPEVVRFG